MIVSRIINNIVRTRLMQQNGTDLSRIRKTSRVINYCDVFNLDDQNRDDTSKHVTKKVQKKNSVQVLLLREDDSVMTTTLENAEKLAKHQRLKLVKTTKLKSNKPVYELVNITRSIKEEKTAANKNEKQIIISDKITHNDLMIKLKNIGKQLTKGHSVKIILFQNHKQKENNLRIIEKEIQHCGKIIMQTVKDTNTIYFIKPIVKASNDEVKL